MFKTEKILNYFAFKSCFTDCRLNYISSSVSDVNDNKEKTRKKAGMILLSNFDRCKVNPLIYVKFWKQACIPSLLFGTELMSITPSLFQKLERCHSWFLKNVFFCTRLCFKHTPLETIWPKFD